MEPGGEVVSTTRRRRQDRLESSLENRATILWTLPNLRIAAAHGGHASGVHFSHHPHEL